MRATSDLDPDAATDPYKLPSHRLSVRPAIDVDKALRLAGETEDDETVHKR